MQTVPVDLHATFKTFVIDEWRQKGWTKSELARRMGCDEAEVRRVLNPTYRSRLPTLEQAAQALGFRAVISVEPIQ